MKADLTASFAPLIVSLLVIGVSSADVGGAADMLPSSVEDVVQPAVTWLLSRRRNDVAASATTGWGPETPRALLALLRLSEGAKGTKTTVDSGILRLWDADGVQGHLGRQLLDIQLLLFFLKNQGCTSTAGGTGRQELANSMATYALALAAMCRNPKDFYQHDIIGPIMTADRGQDDEEEVEEKRARQPFTFAYNVLAVCAGGGHVKRRHVVRLLEMASNQSTAEIAHNIDIQSMVAMAISCLSRNSAGSGGSTTNNKYRHLAEYLEQPLRLIAAQQQLDGSFDHNLATTALAVQALTMMDKNGQQMQVTWRLDAALDWFRSVQKSDGSFGDLFTTTEVLLALSGRGYGTLGRCSPSPPADPATSVSNSTESSPVTTTTIASAGPRVEQPGTIHFTYVVWIGQNRSEVNAIRLSIPANSTFYEAMKTAAEADPRFEFSATVWPNGHYVHTIAGHRDQSIGFHFWLLFRMPFMPDPQDPPPTTYVAPAGVDDLYPQEGEYYLFWYKDV